VVQVSRGADAYTLRRVGRHRLPPGAIVEGEVSDADLLATEIREFWSSHPFRGKSVILGVANARVVVRFLHLPRMEAKDLKSAISFEAQNHIPMALDEAVCDYVVFGPNRKAPTSIGPACARRSPGSRRSRPRPLRTSASCWSYPRRCPPSPRSPRSSSR
jgi:Tfp pilus assembly PilM family ATPase